MNNPQTDQILDTAEILFLNREGSYVSLETLSKESQVEEVELRKQFPNEVLVCASWLNRTDKRSEKIHEAILAHTKPAVQKVDDYFSSLVTYMEENQYRGCVFTRVASGLKFGEKEQPIADVIAAHKKNLLKFFCALAVDISRENADILGNSLFLLYSGATTESRNACSLAPVQAAKHTAMMLCKAYS